MTEMARLSGRKLTILRFFFSYALGFIFLVSPLASNAATDVNIAAIATASSAANVANNNANETAKQSDKAPEKAPDKIADKNGLAAMDANSEPGLYHVFKQNYRSDHKLAYSIALRYLKEYPNGDDASEVARWVSAYEKVTGKSGPQNQAALSRAVETVNGNGDGVAAAPMPITSTAVSADPARPAVERFAQATDAPPTPAASSPFHAPLPSLPGGGNTPAPSLSETQDWLLGWLEAHAVNSADTATTWRFDSCRLYAIRIEGGCYRRVFIDFDKIDPSTLKIAAGSEDNLPNYAIQMHSSTQRPIYHEDALAKNLGTVQSPVPAGLCRAPEANDDSGQPHDRISQSYFTANSAANASAEDETGHAMNAVRHLITLCGGKASPF